MWAYLNKMDWLVDYILLLSGNKDGDRLHAPCGRNEHDPLQYPFCDFLLSSIGVVSFTYRILKTTEVQWSLEKLRNWHKITKLISEQIDIAH